MTQATITALVTEILSRTPEWIRKDLASKDALSRIRAEEALAVLIATAISTKRQESNEA